MFALWFRDNAIALKIQCPALSLHGTLLFPNVEMPFLQDHRDSCWGGRHLGVSLPKVFEWLNMALPVINVPNDSIMLGNVEISFVYSHNTIILHDHVTQAFKIPNGLYGYLTRVDRVTMYKAFADDFCSEVTGNFDHVCFKSRSNPFLWRKQLVNKEDRQWERIVL